MSQNTKPGKHLEFNHPAMVQVRQWVSEQVAAGVFSPRMIGNFDQVWAMAFRPRRATLQQSGSANATDEFKGKPFLRKMRRVFERCLNKPFTEESLLPQHQQDPTMTGGTAANVPVDGWRVPRTLTTLSWADGSLGRGYITYRESDGVSEKARHRLNQDMICFNGVE